MRYYSTFPSAIPHLWAGYSRVTRPSATVHLLNLPEGIINRFLVRLACVRHAASVRPEPGSNSRLSLLYIHSIKECYIRSFADVSSSASFFPNFLCIKNSQSNCQCYSHFQELTLFIFQCTSLSHRQLYQFTTYLPICQHFFLTFFRLVHFVQHIFSFFATLQCFLTIKFSLTL